MVYFCSILAAITSVFSVTWSFINLVLKKHFLLLSMLKIVAQLIFVEAVKNYVMNRKNSMYLKKTLLSHYCRYNVSMLNKSISLLKKKNILTPNFEKIVCDYDAILYKVTDQVRFYLLSKTSFYSHLMLGRC